MNTKQKRIKIFSHTDFDGLVSPQVFKRLYPYTKGVHDNVLFDIEYCETGKNGTINEQLRKFIGEGITSEYDLVGLYIMDLAPTDEQLAIDIIEFVDRLDIDFACIDHHKTAEWLERIDERYLVLVEDYGQLQSGTSLVFDLLTDGATPLNNPVRDTLDMSELVRSYDTWDWHNDPNDLWGVHAEQFNNLLYILGHDRFIERLESNFSTQFTEVEQLLIDLDEEKKEKYISKKIDSAICNIYRTYKGHLFTYALVDGEQYHSVLGNRMCSEIKMGNELIDFAVIRNGNKLSFRSIKEHVDVSEIAKEFNGGGHKHAAGGKGNINYLV